jgi:hypothetical protein
MKRCPTCGLAASDAAHACVECGHVFTADRPPHQQEPDGVAYAQKGPSQAEAPPPQQNSAAFGCIFIVVVFLLIGWAGQRFGCAGTDNDEIGAYVAAESFVERRLIAPRTAKFSSYSQAEVSREEGTQIYSVAGWVDSQNAFGALLRKHWFAKVEKTEDGWRLLHIFIE